MYKSFIIFLSLFFILTLAGCGGIFSTIFGNQSLHNYTQDPGVTANDPKVIDGNLNTVGKSVFIAKFKGPSYMFKTYNPIRPNASTYSSYDRYLAPPSETLINLPQRKIVNKIVIYSTNLVDFVVQARGDFGQWRTVYEQRAENLKNNRNKKKDYTMYNIEGKGGNQRIVVANDKFPVFTDGIRIYVLRTTDDATQRQENTEPGYSGFRWQFDGKPGKILTRRVNGYIVSPALIREVKIYGYVAKEK